MRLAPLRLLTVLMFLVLGHGSSLAVTNVGVRGIMPKNETDTLAARGFAALVSDDLARLIFDRQDKKMCPVAIYDISPEGLTWRVQEEDLRESGVTDPSTATPVEESPVNTFIDGVLGQTGNYIDYILEVSGMDGVSKLHLEGTFAADALPEEAAAVAAKLADHLCAFKAYRVKANYNDLLIDQTICNIESEFFLYGKGPSTGIILRVVPAGNNAGSFEVMGTAGGALWSGGGAMASRHDESGGEMQLKGTWSVTAPFGKFSHSGTIKAALSALETCGFEDEDDPPPPPKKKEKKKKKKKEKK